jgi:sodium/potassium-transporting ATPase subunit alpha
MCTHILIDGKPLKKDEGWEKIFQETNEFFGNKGQRVLGFAKLHLTKDKYS